MATTAYAASVAQGIQRKSNEAGTDMSIATRTKVPNPTLTPARYTHDLILDKIMIYGILT